MQKCGNYSIMYMPSKKKEKRKKRPCEQTNLSHPPDKRKLKAFQKA